jgi:hypothetical protein
MIASFVPPHFGDDAVSTATYLTNIQPSSALQGGIPNSASVASHLITPVFVIFGCLCYFILGPCEGTKLTPQSVECVFLSYNVEHKGYHCWDRLTRRMRIFRTLLLMSLAHSIHSLPLMFLPRSLLSLFAP